MQESAANLFKSLEETVLSPEGTFKYILIEVELEGRQEPLRYIRGDVSCGYHAENLEKFEEEVGRLNVPSSAYSISCPGGGRVVHSASKQTLSIYGYSQSFGQADHNLSLEIIRRTLLYPEGGFSLSFEGY